MHFPLLNEHKYFTSILENLYSIYEKYYLSGTWLYSTPKAEKDYEVNL